MTTFRDYMNDIYVQYTKENTDELQEEYEEWLLSLDDKFLAETLIEYARKSPEKTLARIAYELAQ